MDLSDFIGAYPSIDDESTKAFYNKTEFSELQITAEPDAPTVGKYMKHQLTLQRFLADYTDFDSALVAWNMGSGKTCGYVGVIESLRANIPRFRGAIILANGEPLLGNIRKEMATVCTCEKKTEGRCSKGPFLPEDPMLPAAEEQFTWKKINEFYTLDTFQKFVRHVVDNSSDEMLQYQFNDHIIVLDEVHNIRHKTPYLSAIFDAFAATRANTLSLVQLRTEVQALKHDDFAETAFRCALREALEPTKNAPARLQKVDDAYQIVGKPSLHIYGSLHRFLHTVKNCKIVLASGTPMKDRASELADVMNLILPSNKQLPTGANFDRKFFDNDGQLQAADELQRHLRGRVSYVGSDPTDAVALEFQGMSMNTSPNENLNAFTHTFSKMSEWQSEVYRSTIQTERSLEDFCPAMYTDARQASCFVFPPRSGGGKPYGTSGFNHFITKSADRGTYTVRPELMLAGTRDEKLARLQQWSSKYASAINIILNNPTELTYVFHEFVKGSGAIVFAKMLEQFDFVEGEGTPDKRGYVILTSDTVKNDDIAGILDKVNHPDNKHGKKIQVVIGSSITSEGFSLKNFQRCFVMTGHWNFSETDQVIHRVSRAFAHTALLADWPPEDRPPRVAVHLDVAYPDGDQGINHSIELNIYRIARSKDARIKQVERVLKTAAFDCWLNRARNQSGQNGSRACDYQDCEFPCDGVPAEGAEDHSTYNLYYNKDTVAQLEREIMLFFKSHFIASHTDLANLLQTKVGERFTDYRMLVALEHIINNAVTIHNKYGLQNVLRESSNFYFLVPHSSGKPEPTAAFYSEFPAVLAPPSENSVRQLALDNARRVVRVVSQLGTMARFQEILSDIASEFYPILLEENFDSDMFKQYFRVNPNGVQYQGTVHQVGPIPRERVAGEWRDAEYLSVAPETMHSLLNRASDLGGYFGVMEHAQTFDPMLMKIRAVADPSAVYVTDNQNRSLTANLRFEAGAKTRWMKAGAPASFSLYSYARKRYVDHDGTNLVYSDGETKWTATENGITATNGRPLSNTPVTYTVVDKRTATGGMKCQSWEIAKLRTVCTKINEAAAAIADVQGVDYPDGSKKNGICLALYNFFAQANVSLISFEN